ncbi:AAA family ATPase [Haloferula rosea]|uniref:SMC family ATPase n=1 Tax=Haloferula rosea TaxID=490093 RepID=A0A934VE34_9BACT|nr:SMC family ATPase [Haloferula rosea]MBK1826894.1 SMC family ATPase [Haloferula rosea]
MRLLSLHVRNYRVHLDQTIEFDPARTLIGGPNESGKSTLAEAAHRALFTNHRWGGKILDSMRSRHSSEPPEVRLRFHADGQDYDLTKVFAGTTKGRAELRDDRQNQWTGNDAEEKLAQLLGNEGPASKKEAESQWAHLWIRQGDSAEDPSEATTHQKDSLTARLQQEGGAAVLQSDRDSRVANAFLEKADSLFNQNGKAKSQSPLAQAERAHEEARQRFEQAQARANQLQQAAADHHSARQRLAQATAALPELEKQLTENQKQLAQAASLEEQDENARKALEDSELSHKVLKETDLRIRALDEEIAQQSKAIGPREEASQRLNEQLQKLEADRQSAATAADEASRKLRTARTALDIAQAHRQRIECIAAQQKATRRLEEAATLDTQLQDLRKQLAQLPAITTERLEKLRQHSARYDQAKAALDAMATGVELLDGPGPAQLDGTPLEKGSPRIISTIGTLEIAGTTVHIHPGGGKNLEQLQEALKTTEQTLAEAFATLGVPSIEEATQHLIKRDKLEKEIEALATKHASLEPTDTKHESERLAARRVEIDAQLERLQSPSEATPLPDHEADIATFEAEARKSMDAASTAEQDAIGTRHGLENRLKSLRSEQQETDERLKAERRSLAEAEVKQKTLVEEHGSAPDRTARLAELQQKATRAREQFNEIHRQLKALQPEQLKHDEARLNRSIRQQTNVQASARESLAAARATLQSDGSSDPHSDLAEARQQLEAAAEDERAAARRAQATQRLAALFREERQRLADRFTAPLSAKVGDYLKCLFGSEAVAGLKLEDGKFGELEIGRPNGQFDFTTLSGGTREQVAAAMRLAVAELLAADHDGCLPIVFDDSFTHSDPDRVLKLQRMLDLAASRGLQVIVLTCTPADYSSLGASEIQLTQG